MGIYFNDNDINILIDYLNSRASFEYYPKGVPKAQFVSKMISFLNDTIEKSSKYGENNHFTPFYDSGKYYILAFKHRLRDYDVPTEHVQSVCKLFDEKIDWNNVDLLGLTNTFQRMSDESYSSALCLLVEHILYSEFPDLSLNFDLIKDNQKPCKTYGDYFVRSFSMLCLAYKRYNQS